MPIIYPGEFLTHDPTRPYKPKRIRKKASSMKPALLRLTEDLHHLYNRGTPIRDGVQEPTSPDYVFLCRVVLLFWYIVSCNTCLYYM